MTEESLYQAAMQLPPDERVLLADRILASVGDVQIRVSDEWMAEIRRRIEAFDRGEMESIDGETALREIRESLGS